ncbi:MAG: hypothetical protein K2J30_05465 [Clostridia bacterium]|nr:hypothetical protein [Clostridia bacterium]
MLDERTGRLLIAINGMCEKGSFKLVEESELLKSLPPTCGVDGATLRAMLNYLEDGKYIEVGYAEEGEYCLRPLPEGRLYTERMRRERGEAMRRRRDSLLLALAGGFSGGFFGSLAAWLIAALAS